MALGRTRRQRRTGQIKDKMMLTTTRRIRTSLALAGVLAVGLSGCGGTQKPGLGKPGGGGGDALAGGGDSVESLGVTQPTRKVSEEEKEDFSEAMARYLDLKKRGELDRSDCDRAAAAFGKAADANKNLVEARYNQGAVLAECGRENEAMQIFEQLARGPKPYSRAVTNLGLAAFKKGDRASAEQQFVRAIELDQNVNSVAARNNLAIILRDQLLAVPSDQKRKIAGRAVEHLRAVLALDGDNLLAYATLCFIYHELGLPEMAKLIGDQAIRRADEIATGVFEEEKSSEGEPDAGKGKGKTSKGGPKTETKTEKKKVKIEGTGYTRDMTKNLALVYNTLGLVDLKKKNVTSALANFRTAIQRDPDLSEARMNLAAVALNFRDYNTAEENFRAVLKAQPANYEATLGLGVALRGNRKVEEAEAQYLAAQKLDPQNPKSYYNLGLLYQDYKGSQKPELQKAQEYYRQYLAKTDARDGRRQAEKRIKDIDEMFAALAEAEKLQAEAEKLQREAEEQQRRMEEEMKKEGGAPPPDPASPPPAAQPAGGAPQAAVEPAKVR
jgi:tetratricopeptide (TPR) repeat protein